LEHFRENIEHGFARGVAVALVREHDQAGRGSETLQGGEKTLRLDREGARVVVGLAVEELMRKRVLGS
jgi:hypothetical protein